MTIHLTSRPAGDRGRCEDCPTNDWCLPCLNRHIAGRQARKEAAAAKSPHPPRTRQ